MALGVAPPLAVAGSVDLRAKLRLPVGYPDAARRGLHWQSTGRASGRRRRRPRPLLGTSLNFSAIRREGAAAGECTAAGRGSDEQGR
jgi:hypothetical protein